jgi:putative MATE family efflux protein
MHQTEINLGDGKIGSMLLRLSVPAILSQIVNLLYNIVDRIFIGRLPEGHIAMAGLGIAMPVVMLISAFSLLIGCGGAPLAAIQMGKGKNEEAEKILGNSFCLLLINSALLMAVFLLFKTPILQAFGASGDTLPYAVDYTTIYLLGTLFVQMTSGLNPFINTQGYTKTGMISVLIGAIANLILDPIFIFVFGMGVKGAALASVIAQFLATLWVLHFLYGAKTKLRIRKKFLKLRVQTVKKILSLGVAPFIMHGSESVILIALNTQLLRFGGDPGL